MELIDRVINEFFAGYPPGAVRDGMVSVVRGFCDVLEPRLAKTAREIDSLRKLYTICWLYSSRNAPEPVWEDTKGKRFKRMRDFVHELEGYYVGSRAIPDGSGIPDMGDVVPVVSSPASGDSTGEASVVPDVRVVENENESAPDPTPNPDTPRPTVAQLERSRRMFHAGGAK
jgi:hypothetical protein